MSLIHTPTTSYLLENLHCPSCVSLIKSVLQATFGDKILWVSPNIVTSIVTVEHRESSLDLVRSIGRTLQDVGFKIEALDSTVDTSPHRNQESTDGGGLIMPHSDNAGGRWSSLWIQGPPSPAPQSTHLENCKACQLACHTADVKGQAVKPSSTVISHITDTESGELSGIITDDGSHQTCWRVTMSIGGMSCASCSNAITDELQKLPWVSKAAVNLVGNSATIDYVGSERSNELVGVIEDMGYDAAIDKVTNLSEERKPAGERLVDVEVEGIFCPRCPERILRTLKGFSPSVQILQKPTFEHPFLKVQYVPNAPHFTIRHILRGIEATDPCLRAKIYHPPTLEERSRDIRAKHNRQLLYRELMVIVVAIPTFILGIVFMSLVPKSNPTRRHLMEPWKSGLSRLQVILCLLATPVYFFAADIFHIRALKELQTLWRPGSRTPLLQRFYRFGSMNMLMSLGTTIAYFSSVAQMIAAAADGDKAVPEDRFYFDSVVFLTLFLLAGRLIEAYSKSKTGDAVEALAKLRPSTALLIEQDGIKGQSTTMTDMDQLESGDLIRIPHGTSPAVDGVVVEGETTVDESSLTGESRPIRKGEGDAMYAGTVNKGHTVTMRVTGTSGKSMLDQIVQVVREGQTKRAPMEQIADLMTSYFVPVITAIAMVTWAVWMSLALTHRVSSDELSTSGGATAFAFEFAIAVFVVACPCGLALAAPTAIFVGGGIAARNGILVKGGGEAFEKASKVSCVVFDKTGTLTVGGEPRITDAVIDPDGRRWVEEKTLLGGLKAMEECSSHPMAKALVEFCRERNTPSAEMEGVEEVPGRGIRARYKGQTTEIAAGNEKMMAELAATISSSVGHLLETWKREAKSVALVAVRHDGAWTVMAGLAMSDPIRDEAAAVVAALRRGGIEVWMLSGDNATTAQAVAHRVGIARDNVLAEVLPSDKAAKIRYLQAMQASGELLTSSNSSSSSRNSSSRRHHSRGMVAMVGDGINDSPALTTADVGIAIGTGSDVAISSAAFVLATSNLHSVLTLLDLSRAVLTRIKVNFGWAAVYNVLAVPLAAGCLYAVRTPAGAHVKLDPVWASLAMALSSISVVLSSLSLRTRIPGLGFRRQG